MTTDALPLDWSAKWMGAKVRVTIAQGDKVVFVDKCDPASADARERLFAHLQERLPAVDREPIEARLLSMAAEGVEKPPPVESTFTLPPNPPAWEEPVEGATLLDEIESLLLRYVVLPEHAAPVVALWIVHTYVADQFSYSPRLLVSSPEKRCGKSLLLRFVAGLSARPLPCENISTAALYRSIEKFAPTLILDEADTFLAGRNANEEMRGVINAGFARGGCVLRCVGDDMEPTQFHVFGPLALGMIGKPQGTIEDRSVSVQMRRKVPGDLVHKLPPGRPLREILDATVRRIVRWTADHGPALATAVPMVPGELDDRAGDCWFSLLAIADAAGGRWPADARLAAIGISSDRDATSSHALMLLADLRDILSERRADRLRTLDILDALEAKDERPWPDYRNGKPINARQVAHLLEPFGVRPDKWKANEITERGYLVESFADAWERYLPPDAGSATPPPATNGAGCTSATQADPRREHAPPGLVVADGGGTVAGRSGAISAGGSSRWRQVAAGESDSGPPAPDASPTQPPPAGLDPEAAS